MKFRIALQGPDNKSIFIKETGKIGYDSIRHFREVYDENIKIEAVHDEKSSCFRHSPYFDFLISDEHEDIIRGSKKFEGDNSFTIKVDEEFLGLFTVEYADIKVRKIARENSLSSNPFIFIPSLLVDWICPIVEKEYYIKTKIDTEAILQAWRQLGFPESMTKSDVLKLRNNEE